MKIWKVISSLSFLIEIGPARHVLASEVFRAEPPYSPTVAGKPHRIDLRGIPRVFDFSGVVPFLNSETGAIDFATIHVWDPVIEQATVLAGTQIPPHGVVGRVFKTNGYTAIGYVKGDGIVEGKLRTQINSYPIPARRHFVWELSFRLGGSKLASPWRFTKPGIAPTTLWQLISAGLPPTLVMAVDTDPTATSKVALNFDSRLEPPKPAVRIGDASGLSTSEDIEVRIEANLDERPVLRGKGFVRVWVNNKLVVDRYGPTLQEKATSPYYWSIGMYLYNNSVPLDIDRFVYWKKARMLVTNVSVPE